MVIEKLSDKNPRDKQGNTPLHVAAQSGHKMICELIVDNIKEVNLENIEGTMPLHLAAKRGHYQICKLLLVTTHQPNQTNNALRTPLHYAAEGGHLKTCELLIQRRANVNVKDREGHAPIQLACKNGHSEVGRLLINQMLVDTAGTSTLLNAALEADMKVFETINDFGDLNLCQILFDYIGIRDTIDVFQFSHYAQATGCLKNPQVFLNNTELLIDQDGWKLIHHAVRIGILEICELIIENIEDKNPGGKAGLTAYHCAAWGGNLEICQLIAKHIEETNPTDNDGKTPLYYAKRNGHDQVAEFISDNIKDKGAKGKQSFNSQSIRFERGRCGHHR